MYNLNIISSEGISLAYDDELKKYIRLEAIHSYQDFKNSSNNKLTNILWLARRYRRYRDMVFQPPTDGN